MSGSGEQADLFDVPPQEPGEQTYWQRMGRWMMGEDDGNCAD